MSNLLKFYKAVLADLGMTVDKKGDVYIDVTGESQRVKVKVARDDKRVTLPLSLPTEEYMAEEDNTVRAYFHPASECYTRGQPEILNAVIRLSMVNLYVDAQHLTDTILQVAGDKDKHANLSQAVISLINDIPDVTNNTLKVWKTFRNKLTGTARPRPLLQAALRRNETVDGTEYPRVCRISHTAVESDLFGDKMSNVAREAITSVYKRVLGDERVVFCSSSQYAPYMMAFLNAYHEQMTQISAVYRVMRKHCSPSIKFKGAWLADLNKVKKWYNTELYVQLEGNVGMGGVDESEDDSTASVTRVGKRDTPASKPVSRSPAPRATPTPKKTKMFQPPAQQMQQPIPPRPMYAPQQPVMQPPPQPMYAPAPQMQMQGVPGIQQSMPMQAPVDAYGRPLQQAVQPPQPARRYQMK